MANEFTPLYQPHSEKEKPAVKYEELFRSDYVTTGDFPPAYVDRIEVGDGYFCPNGLWKAKYL